jgi:cyclic pyranopterin phosphate synthase
MHERELTGNKLSHVGPDGSAHMVDISGKPPLVREAVACGAIRMSERTMELIESGGLPKGDVLAVARVAGIQAAKETSRLIPLCHSLPLAAVSVAFQAGDGAMLIEVRVRTTAATGVEMEALTAVSVAALTLYDMCKAVDKGMEIGAIRLVSKTKTAPVAG